MSRSFAAFVAGLGTGYMTSKKQQEDRARQDKIDQITFDRADAEKKDRVREQALQDALQNSGKTENPSTQTLNPEQLQQAAPQVFADGTGQGDDTLTGQQKAQVFESNGTPEQRANVAGFLAKQGLTNLGENQVTGANDQGIQVADPAQAVEKPLWKTMEEKAKAFAVNGYKPEHQAAAFQMLERASNLKSKDYQEKIIEARKGGLDGLLALANGHDNEEMPFTDLSVAPSADGKTAAVSATNVKTGKAMSMNFDLRNGSVEDQLTQRLMAISSPEAMMQNIASQIQQARDNRKEDKQDKIDGLTTKQIQQKIDAGEIELKNLPEKTRLELEKDRAGINQANAATAHSNAETSKTKFEINQAKNGLGKDSKLPEKVREAMWYQSANPEQQAAFDKLNAKGGDMKVTADGEGGFVVNQNNALTKVDRKGNVSNVNLKPNEAAPAKQPTYKKLWSD